MESCVASIAQAWAGTSKRNFGRISSPSSTSTPSLWRVSSAGRKNRRGRRHSRRHRPRTQCRRGIIFSNFQRLFHLPDPFLNFNAFCFFVITCSLFRWFLKLFGVVVFSSFSKTSQSPFEFAILLLCVCVLCLLCVFSELFCVIQSLFFQRFFRAFVFCCFCFKCFVRFIFESIALTSR